MNKIAGHIHTPDNDCLVYTDAKYAVNLGQIGQISSFISLMDAKRFVTSNFKVEEVFNSETQICYQGKDIVISISML